MTRDALVLGVGGMGAAALAHLADRGLDVVGIEQDEVPSLRGSSVGQTRIIRKAYFEDPRYVPLLHRAYELWSALEEATATSLYVRTGCLNLGPATHPDIRGVRESVSAHGLPHELLDAAEVRRAFPAFVPAETDIGIHERDAGYLRVEACTEAHAKRAVARGAELRTRTRVTALTLGERHVRATLSTGEVVTARHLVVAAGAWLAGSAACSALADALPPLVVTRQVQHWFGAKEHTLATAPKMPAFIHFVGERAYYGLPLADPLAGGARALKVCRHHGGEATTAETLDRAVRASDEVDVRGYIRAHLPNADGPLLHSQVCMYTNTPDHHFVVGAHPRWAHVVVLGGFSGHGYKMASVMGEIAADLVTRGRTDFDIALFRPSRRSS